jgi:AcrR family transcriptional regulator
MVQPKKRVKPLTKDELFETALAIADEHGLAALTMRRLGDAVGVEAASLYHHLPNKDALVDGMLVKMRSEMRIPDPIPEDWKDLMEAIFEEYRRVLALHPALLPYAGRRVETDPDSGLVFLVQMGFSNDDAVDLWQSTIALTVGFSVFSSSFADSDVFDLPDDLAKRMSEWRTDTYTRTLRMILDRYEAVRGS